MHTLESHWYIARTAHTRDNRRMYPLKKPAQERNEKRSGAGALDESGVHSIPPEARAALRANDEKRAQDAAQAEVRYRRPVRGSTNEVCPKMLETHLYLVHQVVAPIARRVPANVLRDDLLAAGVSGLVDSLRKNGGDGGTTFEWYARTRIRGAVLDELRAQDWLTRRARDAVNAASLLEETDTDGPVFVGLDEITAAEEQEFLVSAAPDPEALYEAMEPYRMIARAFGILSERERKVIGMYYFGDKKFKEIGAELDVSEPRVSHIHARAVEKLKSVFSEKKSSRPAPRASSTEPVETEPSHDDWDSASPLDVA
jgi:RNA polymerase sigma factor FliA